MNRTLISAFAAAGLFTLPAIALAADEIPAAPLQPTLTTTAPQSAAVDAYMQALIQKCLDNGVLFPDQVQAMTDDQLNAALTNCANTLQAQQAAPPQVVRRAPVVVQDEAPVVVRRRQRVVVNEQPAFVQQAPSQFNIGNNSGNNSGNGNVVGGLGDVLGGLANAGLGGGGNGGGGNGGGAGGGGAGGGGAVADVPAIDPLDARIAGLESGIKEGINTSALSQGEAAILNARLGAIQAQRANLGDTPGNRLELQRQLDAAVADFNNRAHNGIGIPNPELFRALKRRDATTTALNGQLPNSRFAAMRARLAAARNGQTGQVATPGAAGNSRFAAMRARVLAARNGQAVGQTGNNRFARFIERRRQQQANVGSQPSRRCFRAPCNGAGTVAATTSGSSVKNRFVQRRIEQFRQAKASHTNVSSSRGVMARQIFQRRQPTNVSTSRTNRVKSFLGRRLASAR